MALGVSSYSEGGGRRRPPREPGPYGPTHPWRNLLNDLAHLVETAWPYVCVPLSLLAVAHVVLLLLFPAGRNDLLGATAEETPAYLSLLPAPDTLGFYATDGVDAFIVYKIFTEDGDVVEGIFPDPDVAPKLRYDRWAAAANAAAGPYPALHAFVSEYVLSQLPTPPVRMELYAARWRWDRNSLNFPWPGLDPEATLDLRLLGSYNGLTRTWQPPAPPKQSRRRR